VFIGLASQKEKRKPIASQSEIGNLRRLQLKLQFIGDKGDEFGIRGFSLGIADGVAEKSLQSVQITSVPGYFDGVSDGTLHSAWGGLECFRHLGIQYLGDGIGVLTARLEALPDAAGEPYKD
jgi:hypothetical protein